MVAVTCEMLFEMKMSIKSKGYIRKRAISGFSC
jgi:hypothetical protein